MTAVVHPVVENGHNQDARVVGPHRNNRQQIAAAPRTGDHFWDAADTVRAGVELCRQSTPHGSTVPVVDSTGSQPSRARRERSARVAAAAGWPNPQRTSSIARLPLRAPSVARDRPGFGRLRIRRGRQRPPRARRWSASGWPASPRGRREVQPAGRGWRAKSRGSLGVKCPSLIVESKSTSVMSTGSSSCLTNVTTSLAAARDLGLCSRCRRAAARHRAAAPGRGRLRRNTTRAAAGLPYFDAEARRNSTRNARS